MKTKMPIRLAIIPVVAALVGFAQFQGLMPDTGEQRVELSTKPLVLGTKPIRLSTHGQAKVLGVTTDICATLSHVAAQPANIDAEYDRLKGGAHLFAILHARDGKDYRWKCDNWTYSSNVWAHGGAIEACMRWECNKTPPKGTDIVAIDLGSDLPLRVLGAYWNSTANFDFVSQPPPDRFATSSAQYADLEHAFAGQPAWGSPAKPALQVTLESNRRRWSRRSEFNSSLLFRIADAGIQLQPGRNAIGMTTVTIPTDAVEACSMTCSRNLARETDLILSRTGTQLGILNSPELINWCWNHRIPMATGASRRAWLYKGTPLPPRNTHVAQFASRAAYDRQVESSCAGY